MALSPIRLYLSNSKLTSDWTGILTNNEKVEKIDQVAIKEIFCRSDHQ